MKKTYIPKENLINEYKKTKLMLKKAKQNNLKVIAVDYDGTIIDRYDPKYNNLLKVIELANTVTQKGIEFAFVSGRDTTLEVELQKTIPKFCKKNNTSLTIWRSGGNGMNLNKVTYSENSNNTKVEKIYSYILDENLSEIALKVYDDLKIKPDIKSQIFFRNFLDQKLPEYLVPKDCLNLSKKYNGKIFAESVKITFVLPTDQREQRKYIEILRNKLSPYGLNVGWGRIPFADVSKELKENGRVIDGKLLMVKNIIKRHHISDKQIVTFGDAPNDNNKGLLSLPFSFTNDAFVNKKNLDSPPFILKVAKSPVEAVYQAIHYLIS